VLLIDLGPSTSCPDSEALAAYIDRGLMKRERIVLEEHLASCPTCIALIAGVVRVLSALMGVADADGLG
jgi:anti-sigma factor RsiW